MNKMILKNPSFSTTPDVRDICDDYFRELNINLHFFGHETLFPDGRHYCLNSSSSWAEWHLIEQELPPNGYTIYDQMENAILLPKMDSGRDLGWPDEAMKFAKDRFGIENPMLIFRKHIDRLESFFFDLRDEKSHEQFINHFDIFENFIYYYKDKAKTLLKKASENPLIVPEKYFNPDIHIQKPQLFDEKLIFDPEGVTQSNKQLPKQYYFTHFENNYSITTREYQCLSLFAHGAKIKDVAVTLYISTRTIDTHLISIKRKLRVKTLAEAVEIYWRNRIGSSMPG